MTLDAFTSLLKSQGLATALLVALGIAYWWKDHTSVPKFVYDQECDRGNKLADAYHTLSQGVALLLDRSEK